jgi:hypothetical protein
MNWVLGLSEAQMNTDYRYGGVTINQLEALESWDLFTGIEQNMLRSPDQLTRLVDPSDRTKSLETRARSFLHSNCTACHVMEGGGNSRMQLEITTPLEQTGLIDGKPMHGPQGLMDARIVAPGCPERSVLIKRMGTRGPGQMPPIASHEVDQQGKELLEEWIRSLKPTAQ